MKNIIIIGNDASIGKATAMIRENAEKGLSIKITAEQINEQEVPFILETKECIQRLAIMDKELENFEYMHLTNKEKNAIISPVRIEPKISRNALCQCGSGKKYKKCCINKPLE